MSDLEPTVPVATVHGQVRGLRKAGVSVFKGLRYGADTGGAGRFRPPQPVSPWSGVQDAFDFGPQSPQMRSPLADKGPMSEDCLRLNIFTPAADAAARPVMVWFHGGGFEAGSGSQRVYDGTRLALRGDVVVVSLNHRLNVFGHCYLGERLGESYAQAGNVGYLDLIAALRWVRDNIAAFGGDPARVTVFGQSAGGVSVTALMAAPDARGLFSGAIAQSGAARIEGDRQLRGTGGPIESLESDGLRMAKSFGIANDTAAPAKLHALSVADLLAYSEKEFPNSMNPVVDGRVMPNDISRIFRAGQQQPVPFLSGTVDREESLLGPYPFKLVDMLRGADPEPVRAAYAGLDEATLAKAFFADSLFRGPARFLAGEMPRVSKPAWLYVFSYVGEKQRASAPGAAHSDDVAFVFGDLGLRGRWRGDAPPTAADRNMATTVMSYWVNFAKHGNPNGPGLTTWPPYQRVSDELLEMGPTISVRKPEREAVLRFLDRGYEAALRKP